MGDSLEIPAEVPVMPLSGAVLFPHALLPLHIFEPRYRAMLAQALGRDRIFCVALIRPGRTTWHSHQDFFDVAGVGLIRACVERSDGTSNLILQGLHRVHFVAFTQDTPFPVATLKVLESRAGSLVETQALGARVLDLYRELKVDGRKLPDKVDRYLSDLNDPEMLADLMASTFITDAARRQQILSELSVTDRLRQLIRYLREEDGTAIA